MRYIFIGLSLLAPWFVHGQSGEYHVRGAHVKVSGNAQMMVRGNLKLDNGASMPDNGTVQVSGNITNNSGITAMQNSVLILNGNSEQELNGSTTLQDMELNNSMGAKLSADWAFHGELKLTNGVLNPDGNLVEINDGATISRTNGYLKEGILKKGGNPVTIPVGDASYFGNLVFTPSNDASNEYEIYFQGAQNKSNVKTPDLAKLSNSESFLIVENESQGRYDLSFQWEQPTSLTTQYDKLTLARWVPSSWMIVEASKSGDANSGQLNTSNNEGTNWYVFAHESNLDFSSISYFPLKKSLDGQYAEISGDDLPILYSDKYAPRQGHKLSYRLYNGDNQLVAGDEVSGSVQYNVKYGQNKIIMEGIRSLLGADGYGTLEVFNAKGKKYFLRFIMN